jgi:hypothetical protein
MKISSNTKSTAKKSGGEQYYMNDGRIIHMPHHGVGLALTNDEKARKAEEKRIKALLKIIKRDYGLTAGRIIRQYEIPEKMELHKGLTYLFKYMLLKYRVDALGHRHTKTFTHMSQIRYEMGRERLRTRHVDTYLQTKIWIRSLAFNELSLKDQLTEVGYKRLEIIEDSYEELVDKYQLLKDALISTHETVAQFEGRVNLLQLSGLPN